MRCFVTVGTTRFPVLIDVVVGDEVLDALHDVGIRELTVQCGSHTSQLLGAPVPTVPRTQVCKDIKVCGRTVLQARNREGSGYAIRLQGLDCERNGTGRPRYRSRWRRYVLQPHTTYVVGF